MSTAMIDMPAWFEDLPDEAQRQIAAFLQAKGREHAQEIGRLRREIARLQAEVDRGRDDLRRVNENRDAEIAQLKTEVSRLQAALAKHPRRPRLVAEMEEELEMWYGLFSLLLFRGRAIGERFGFAEGEDREPQIAQISTEGGSDQ